MTENEIATLRPAQAPSMARVFAMHVCVIRPSDCRLLGGYGFRMCGNAFGLGRDGLIGVEGCPFHAQDARVVQTGGRLVEPARRFARSNCICA